MVIPTFLLFLSTVIIGSFNIKCALDGPILGFFRADAVSGMPEADKLAYQFLELVEDHKPLSPLAYSHGLQSPSMLIRYLLVAEYGHSDNETLYIYVETERKTLARWRQVTRS